MGCILTKNKIKVTILIFLISASLSVSARAADGELREMSSGEFWDLKEGYRLGVVIEGDSIFFTVSKNGQELKKESMKLTLTASFFYYREGVPIISIPTMIRLENNKVQLRLYQRSDNGIPLPAPTPTVASTPNPTPIGTIRKGIDATGNTDIATSINFGQILSGSIEAAKVDTYTFLANANDNVVVRVSKTSGRLWPGIKLYRSDGTKFDIILQETYSTPTAEISYQFPSSGTYSISIYDGFDGTFTGDYNLYLQKVNNPNTATSIDFGRTLSGSIGVAAEMDTYTFLANANDDVSIRVNQTSGRLWPGIRLYGPDGTKLHEKYSTSMTEISYKLPSSGTYTILIYDGFDGELTGDYNLYLSSSKVVATPAPTKTPIPMRTLTVDDSGGADYTRIQDAINAASDEDTVLVYSGTYYENVNVNKRLVLRGIDNGGGKPVVDASGGGYAITLSAGKSTLEGFTAVNAGNLYELAKEFKSAQEGGVKLKNVRGDAGIRVASDNNIIRNNTASNNEEGIRVYDSNNNIVSDNTASNNYLSIYLHYSNNNTVSGNTVSNDIANNIYLWYSNKNIITGNNVRNSIVIDQSSDYNILYQNNLVNAHDGGSNQWDNGINIGNYWSDYKGTDANNDGIGDTPYIINSLSKDSYPLMVPYGGATLPLTPIPTPTSTHTIASSPTPTLTPISNHPPEKSYVRLLALMPMMFLLVQYIKKFSK